jgi:hypothetical protein
VCLINFPLLQLNKSIKTLTTKFVYLVLKWIENCFNRVRYFSVSKNFIHVEIIFLIKCVPNNFAIKLNKIYLRGLGLYSV